MNKQCIFCSTKLVIEVKYEKIKLLMNIKIFKKKHIKNADLTVSALNRSVAHSFFSKSKIKLIYLMGRMKRFYRDYRLPSIASMAFLILLLSFVVIRQFERTSLIALRNEVTDSDNGYSLLLSDDQKDQFTRNDTTETDQPNQSSTSNNTPTNSGSTQSTSPITIVNESPVTSGNGGSGGGGSTGGGGGAVTEPEPFAASINSFTQGNVTLQCSNPSKPNKGSCSKLYTLNAGIRTLNGPGTVNYTWQGTADAVSTSGSIQASESDAITNVSKGVTIVCTKVSTFTLRFTITSPTTSNSNTITVNHNCNEI